MLQAAVVTHMFLLYRHAKHASIIHLSHLYYKPSQHGLHHFHTILRKVIIVLGLDPMVKTYQYKLRMFLIKPKIPRMMTSQQVYESLVPVPW